MIPFNENTLDNWLDSYESFSYEFKRYCFSYAQTLGLSLEFSDHDLKDAHKHWRDVREIWLSIYISPQSSRLSHIKLCSLLMFALSKNQYVVKIDEHDYQAAPPWEFKGNDHDKERMKRDVKELSNKFFGFEFCFLIIDWFEKNRIDRNTEYIQPLTSDMRHDILFYLASDQVHDQALYLILKGLFLRQKKEGGTAN